MTRTPTQQREEGVRPPRSEAGRGTDARIVRSYRAECRREGERLLAWYRQAMVARGYHQQRQVIEMAARNTNYLLPTIRELITVAERELDELRANKFSSRTRLAQHEHYLHGLRSLWEILVEAVVEAIPVDATPVGKV